MKRFVATLTLVAMLFALVSCGIPKAELPESSEVTDSANNDSVFNVSGAWGLRELTPKKYFGEPVKYKFENIELYGVTDYDGYLKSLYSDYMQLPPKDKRHIHYDNAYIKE